MLFILGLKRMSSPVTARDGIVWAGVGMLVATLCTFFTPDMHNYGLMILAMLIGGGAAWYTGKKVAMTDMPQMIAIYNGMGGGAAAAIAAVELLKGEFQSGTFQTLAVAGALIGSVAFSGSMIAFAKLQGLLKKSVIFTNQQIINLVVFVAAIVFGLILIAADVPTGFAILMFFGLALAFGIMMTLPIGGADMPVVISLYNALTGLAVAFEGFVLGQRRHDHRRYRGGFRRYPAHPADGQGHEPAHQQCVVQRLRRQAAVRPWSPLAVP